MKILDTNVLVYHANGRLATPLTGSDFGISIVTEIEVLGHPSLTSQAEADLRSFIGTITVVPISEAIKNEAIRLRKTTRLRLPDAIIAATAIAAQAELLTRDAALLNTAGLTSSAPPLK